MHCIEDALVLVAQNPQLFQLAYRNLKRVVIRRFPFAIFYQIMFDEILVVAVFIHAEILKYCENGFGNTRTVVSHSGM